MSFDHGRDPVVIPGPALERLLSVLVSRSPIPSDWPPRALLVQLAVGVLAALRLEPSYLAIESVAADGRGHRQVFSGEPRLETLTGAEPGTRIYLREQISPRGRIDGVLGQRPEQVLLRQHCRHARTPIFLDGRLISQQPVFSEPKLAAPVVDERGVVIGEAGFVAGPPTPARVLLLANGLLIESLPLLDCRPNFLAAIDVPLPRDLSQAAIARTAELDTALAPVYTVHAQLAPLASTTPQQAAATQPHPALLAVWPLMVFAFVALLELPSGRLGPKLTLAVVLPILCVVLLLMWAGKKWK